jgi:DNA-binding transcriptional LysR family regulator
VAAGALREEVLSGVEEVLKAWPIWRSPVQHSRLSRCGIERRRVRRRRPPEHALHRNRELNFQDLESQMQVVIRDSGRQQPRDVGWLGAEQRWTVGSLATAATFVSSGLGFAWLPRHMIERELKEGTLKLLPLDQGGSRTRVSTCIEQGQTAGPGDTDPHRTAAHLRHHLDAPFAAEQA